MELVPNPYCLQRAPSKNNLVVSTVPLAERNSVVLQEGSHEWLNVLFWHLPTPCTSVSPPIVWYSSSGRMWGAGVACVWLTEQGPPSNTPGANPSKPVLLRRFKYVIFAVLPRHVKG